MDFAHNNYIGFVYHLECISPEGEIRWRDRWENIIPNEGRDYILNAALNNGPQFSAWYIGLYENNYPPTATDAMAAFSAAAAEITTYDETSRVPLVGAPLVDGLYANSVTKAEFSFNAAKTVRGGFISSSGVKNGATGVLLSAVLASSPKLIGAGELLRVVAGLSLITI